jgi:hypothetical protein
MEKKDDISITLTGEKSKLHGLNLVIKNHPEETSGCKKHPISYNYFSYNYVDDATLLGTKVYPSLSYEVNDSNFVVELTGLEGNNSSIDAGQVTFGYVFKNFMLNTDAKITLGASDSSTPEYGLTLRKSIWKKEITLDYHNFKSGESILSYEIATYINAKTQVAYRTSKISGEVTGVDGAATLDDFTTISVRRNF